MQRKWLISRFKFYESSDHWNMKKRFCLFEQRDSLGLIVIRASTETLIILGNTAICMRMTLMSDNSVGCCVRNNQTHWHWHLSFSFAKLAAHFPTHNLCPWSADIGEETGWRKWLMQPSGMAVFTCFPTRSVYVYATAWLQYYYILPKRISVWLQSIKHWWHVWC